MVGSVLFLAETVTCIEIFIFARMETFYRLLYSLIGVQWRCYNMMAEQNLLHFLMDREQVRKAKHPSSCYDKLWGR